VRLAGTLDVQQFGQQQLLVGRTGGGRVDGTLEVGTLAMADGQRFSQVQVGTAVVGEARGVLEVNGGVMRAGQMQVGVAQGGSAHGSLHLLGTDLEATALQAGTGGGSAYITLENTQASFLDDFVLNTGMLSLDRSLLDVGNQFTLGADAMLRVAIGGLGRGTEYGAINASSAMLDGFLDLDFSTLAFVDATMSFDLVFGAEIIFGDFKGFSYNGLATGYSVFTGIEAFNEASVYRVTLARAANVPEPGTLLLLLVSLPALMWISIAARARRANGLAAKLT